VVLPGAHLSNLCRPRSFTAAVLEFLLARNDPAKDPFEEGLLVRREILGHEYVDRSLAQANDLTRDFQWLITRYAWGAVWNRPALDPRARRLLVLAITAAMSRWEEFRLHLRAALRHGMEPCDIRETLLQAAIYAGAPAANTGFHIATEEIERLKTGT
jgi:3-oxoadipate enol-lactonase/4-carboxymuconolactone decarboxylase